MPLNDWKQWAKERPVCVCGVVEDAFWAFMDQKWKDSLNVAAAEPAGWDQGANYWRGLEGAKKGEGERQVATKGPLAGVHVAAVGDSQAVPGRTPRSVKFTELAGCTGSHPHGCAKLLGTRPLKRGTKSLWTTSCLLHSSDEVCFSRTNKMKPVCTEPGCREQHIKWLHEILKELPCLAKGKECKVNVVQGEDRWKTPEYMWMEMEEAGEEVLFVNALQVKEMNSDEELEAEIARTAVAIDNCFRRRAKGAGIAVREPEEKHMSKEERGLLSKKLGDGPGARAKRRKEIEDMDKEGVRTEIRNTEAAMRERVESANQKSQRIGVVKLL
jgi:hypothetical protein